MHPGNTLVYPALVALQDRAVVKIAAILQSGSFLADVTGTIRSKADLVLHRHYLSHPFNVKWKHDDMQKFYDERRHQSDVRPALIWNMQRSINDELLGLGVPIAFNADVDVTGEMAAALQLTCNCAMNDVGRRNLPHSAELVQALAAFKDRYLDVLVERSVDTEIGTDEKRQDRSPS